MNTYFYIIIGILIFFYLFDTLIDILNVRHISTTIPNEFKNVFDTEKYKKSQEYLKANTSFKLLENTLSFGVIIAFITLGGFNGLDLFIREFNLTSIQTGIIYIFSLGLGMQIIGLPFSWVHTFVIEEKFGFNKSTQKTFFLDLLKGILLGGIIGSIILFLVLWFFESFPTTGWIIAWGAVTAIQLILMYIAPTFIMPLFNKFTPLEEGELKTAVENYAKEHKFGLKGLYTMDGSKRSTKSNAFFTGFGNNRRIVLFDTLIEKHTTDELLVILAHEMGHYKKHHIFQTLLLSIISSAAMFYILSFFLNNPDIAAAFKMQNISIYSSIVFFGFLFKPVEEALSIFGNILSRKNEFEADKYAKDTTNKEEALISGLKKLSADNLSNLTPHPLKVFITYSHPPLLDRIKALRS
ncbi:peptidase M48 [Candidatus Marinamargulisbacteria bacterium SCGC AG-343-D04]|nr:peptidase M48 [Candidatus Marinamargulisbacteria bacterium SCGC AG-343-D04]